MSASARVLPHLSVVCPYCKAAVGKPCSIDRRTVSIVVLGVHKPRARMADKRAARAQGRR